MGNMSEMQAAAVAVCDATASLNNGRAMMAVATARNIDLPLVATVNGKAIPFALRDYAFKPIKDGKQDGKLRSAQLTAIMAQGFGEPEEPAQINNAVKTAFNETFGAALYMEANGGAAFERADGFDGFILEDCVFHNVPLAFAFDCFDKEGKLTDTGKSIAERVTAMYSPDTGPEMPQEDAIAQLYTRRVDNVGGTMNRRYGMTTATITSLLRSLSWAAIRDGLREGGPSRSGRTNQPPAPSDVIKGFETFLADIKGEGGESKIALNEAGIKALKALRAKLEATLKAIA